MTDKIKNLEEYLKQYRYQREMIDAELLESTKEILAWVDGTGSGDVSGVASGDTSFVKPDDRGGSPMPR